MSTAALAWFTVATYVIYLVATDGNVYDWLVLQSKLLSVRIRRFWYKIRFHPESPWVQYQIKRNSEKLARELYNHFNKK